MKIRKTFINEEINSTSIKTIYIKDNILDYVLSNQIL